MAINIEFLKNQLSIARGEIVPFTMGNNLEMRMTVNGTVVPTENIVFHPTTKNGKFCYSDGTLMPLFDHQSIVNQFIYFQSHYKNFDWSDTAPSYSLKVYWNNGAVYYNTSIGKIDYKFELNSEENAAMGVPITALFSSLLGCISKRCVSKRKTIRQVEEGLSEIEETDINVKKLLKDLSVEILNTFRTSKLCGSRSDETAHEYLHVIEMIVDEMKSLGFNVKNHSLKEDRDRICRQVISEIKHQIVRPSTNTNRDYLLSFVRPVVTPAKLRAKVSSIAIGVIGTNDIQVEMSQEMQAKIEVQNLGESPLLVGNEPSDMREDSQALGERPESRRNSFCP